MMISFSGPLSAKTPHSRLLYKKKSFEDTSQIFNLWAHNITEIDKAIDELPRVERANDMSYIYLFGSGAKEIWIGREIIGDLPRGQNEFHTFDAFRGEVLSWQLRDSKELLNQQLDLIRVADQLTGLEGDSLSKTWRVEISATLEQISFQFFKTH